MTNKRIPLADANLTAEECEATLRALGAYQIRLFDTMRDAKPESAFSSGETPKHESDLITNAIKKIHRLLEAQSKILD